MDATQDPPSTKRARHWRLFASLLVVGTVAVTGFGADVVAATGAATPPVGAGAVIEDVSESTFNTSTRRRAPRRMPLRPVVGGGARPMSAQVPTVERPNDRWLRLAPPSWRGPPVLLI